MIKSINNSMNKTLNTMVENRGDSKRILDILNKNKEGLTITQIKKISKFPINRVRITLAELEGKGKIQIKKVGSAKLVKEK